MNERCERLAKCSSWLAKRKKYENTSKELNATKGYLKPKCSKLLNNILK